MARIAGPHDEAGASSAEYALLVAAIAAVIVLIVFAVGAFTGELFSDTCTAFDSEPTLTSVEDCPSS